MLRGWAVNSQLTHAVPRALKQYMMLTAVIAVIAYNVPDEELFCRS